MVLQHLQACWLTTYVLRGCLCLISVWSIIWLQMISYDGSDFTSASMSKKSSPVRQDLVQSAGKVVKSIFVPNVGWASQVNDYRTVWTLTGRRLNLFINGCFCFFLLLLKLTSGEVWVQFNDGSQLVVQAGVSCISYTSAEGRITR